MDGLARDLSLVTAAVKVATGRMPFINLVIPHPDNIIADLVMPTAGRLATLITGGATTRALRSLSRPMGSVVAIKDIPARGLNSGSAVASMDIGESCCPLRNTV